MMNPLLRFKQKKRREIRKHRNLTDQEVFSSNATIELDAKAAINGNLSSMSADEYQYAAEKLMLELPHDTPNGK